METYKQILIKQMIFEIFPFLGILIVAILAYITVWLYCSKLNSSNWKWPLYALISIVLLICCADTFNRANDCYLDIKENSYIEYTGNLEFQQDSGTIHHRVYKLVEKDIYVKSGPTTLPVGTSHCYIVYGKHSKYIVAYELR